MGRYLELEGQLHERALLAVENLREILLQARPRPEPVDGAGDGVDLAPSQHSFPPTACQGCLTHNRCRCGALYDIGGNCPVRVYEDDHGESLYAAMDGALADKVRR